MKARAVACFAYKLDKLGVRKEREAQQLRDENKDVKP